MLLGVQTDTVVRMEIGRKKKASWAVQLPKVIKLRVVGGCSHTEYCS